MKKTRKPAPRPNVLPPAVHELAEEQLHSDYLGFVAGTATEDPKHFIARDAAAQQALTHLTRLAELSAEPAGESMPTQEEVIASARVSMACENK